MRTAITSTGDNPGAELDKKFGRCQYFAIYDSESRSVEYIPNPFVNSEDNAGMEAVRLLASRNVGRIISGEFGQKIKPLLDSQKIQMIVVGQSGKKILDILEMLSKTGKI